MTTCLTEICCHITLKYALLCLTENKITLFFSSKTQRDILCKISKPILCLWFRASLIYINNCRTICNTKQSMYYSASSLYMFQVSNTPTSGVHKTVITAFRTAHNVCAAPQSFLATLEGSYQFVVPTGGCSSYRCHCF